MVGTVVVHGDELDICTDGAWVEGSRSRAGGEVVGCSFLGGARARARARFRFCCFCFCFFPAFGAGGVGVIAIGIDARCHFSPRLFFFLFFFSAFLLWFYCYFEQLIFSGQSVCVDCEVCRRVAGRPEVVVSAGVMSLVIGQMYLCHILWELWGIATTFPFLILKYKDSLLSFLLFIFLK